MLDNPQTPYDDNPIMQDSTGEESVNSNYSTWIAGSAVTITLIGALLSWNSSQTTLANNQAVLAQEIKETRTELVSYVAKEIYIVDDRITRFEATVETKNKDVEHRLRQMSDEQHKTNVRAEKNETLLKLVVDAKIP